LDAGEDGVDAAESLGYVDLSVCERHNEASAI
jgi:hypothetical protein